MATETFDNIHLDLSKNPGRCRFADAGLAWKEQGEKETKTLDSQQITNAQWSKASRGYELRIYSRANGIIQLDGFAQEDLEKVTKLFKNWYNVPFENKEHALRGWNWGKVEFGKQELSFNVASRPAFEIPYNEILNTNLAGKNEVAVEIQLPGEGKDANGANGVNGSIGNTTKDGHKSAGAIDQLVEMRFYIPGVASRGDEDEEAENGDEAGEDQNAANVFYETLVEKAEIGEVAGDTFATFLEVLHLTPRGRFDIDLYESSFRLRGKTYSYRIQYDAIKKFFVLPKPDDVHQLICMGLDPPVRQGQTRYPFLVMQFKNDEEVTLDLNMTDDKLKEQYNNRLQSHYEGPQHQVIANVFKGLSGKKITGQSKHFSSRHSQAGVKCSIKANEGFLYPLDRSLLFVPKPATYISFDNVQGVTLSRVGGALTASRTFDLTVSMKNSMPDYQFSSINREEQTMLEEFFKAKGIKVINEMADETSAMLSKALHDPDLASSDDDAPGADRGSADEDDESIDDDFDAGSDSDVAEEYDSDHVSEGGSDDEGSGADAEPMDVDDDEPEELPERPKKKTKTKK
ncbi:SSrecog-domain-containing protein [Microthyrium microscopicum]|uniref:FACT complex subunit POB3 n=1 Tax=Microthyrium microscopicum TaxID=703497 RepID=A0A6A6UQL2_9PEZI|nr:SSrecog-domain-containing protein [Microthyrium microscopicum]